MDKELKGIDAIEDDIIDESVEVEISPDLLSVSMSIISGSPNGNPIRKDNIDFALMEKGVYYGIDDAVIFNALINKDSKKTYIVARGTLPEEGAPAYIEYTRDMEVLGSGIPKTQDAGTVNFKELNFIQNVEAGEILARKIPAKVGKAGVNVLGEKIPGILGKDILLTYGKNTRLNEEDMTVVASVSGNLEFKENKLSISEVLEIQGDINARTGNIDFIGSVVIHGMVHSGYTVKAVGNIDIKGPVEAAVIESAGDIILQGGIQGKEQGVLKAGGNVITKFVERSIVTAGGNVVTESLLHSKIRAGGVVSITAGKGTIVGGDIIAVNGLEAITVGSPMGASTTIKLGAPPEVLAEYKELKEHTAKIERAITDTVKNIRFLQTKQEQEPGSHQGRINTMIRLKMKLERDLKLRKVKLDKLVEIITQATHGTLIVSKVLHSGVKIYIGNEFMQTKSNYENVKVHRGPTGVEISYL